MPVTADKRGYVAGKSGVELDGVFAGWVWSAYGGHAYADVVEEKLGPDHVIRKHLAGLKYEDITVTFGTGMSKAFYEWMKDTFDHKYSRKNGAIVTADNSLVERSRLVFNNALITEIGFPTLDAASKDAAKISLKFSPEYTRTQAVAGAGQSLSGKYSVDAGKQKKWLPANFRLKLDGLDCTRVNKVDALVVKQRVVENPVGELRDYEQEPAHLEVPNLVFTLPESNAHEVYAWHEDFVIKGNNGDDKEKNGTLEYLTPNLKEVLFTLTFKHAGIFRLEPEKVESGSETIRRVKAELYVEEMTFDYKAAWA